VSHAFKTRVETQGVTVAEWVVLRALFDGDGIKPSELAAKIGLTRGAISKLVDRLAAKDLVSVRNDVRDGRAQIITLRASGRRLVPKLAALADENDAAAFGHLDRARRASLLATLKGLVEHLGLRGAPVD
jgi:DNA-binding MarR family transcriptional regulator